MRKAGPAAFRFFHFLRKMTETLGVVAVSCVLFGAFASFAMNSGRDAFAADSSIGMHGIQCLHAIERAMMIIDGAENALLATDIDEKKRESLYSQFDAAKRNLDESLEAYESLRRSPEESLIWKDFTRALDRWGKDHERFVQLAREHDKSRTTETYKSMSAQALDANPPSLSAALSLLDAVIEARLGGREERSEASETAASPHQEDAVGVVVLGGSILAMAIIMMLVSRARQPRRRFRMGGRRLSLDVGTYGKMSSSVRFAKNNEKPL